MAEMVDHPAHYNAGRYEAIVVIENWGLGFSAGNALKYICRAPHKGRLLEDMRKACWYLRRASEKQEPLHLFPGDIIPPGFVIEDWRVKDRRLAEAIEFISKANFHRAFILVAAFVKAKEVEHDPLG